MRKLTLLIGLGAGYVLGAKAGEERYLQIKKAFEDFRGKPQVQQATDVVQQAASDLSHQAAQKVTDKVSGDSVVDLTPTQAPA